MCTIYYGKKNHYEVDVTPLLQSYFLENNIVYLPQGDHYRAVLFGDVLPGVLKSIYVRTDTQEYEIPDTQDAFVHLLTGERLSNAPHKEGHAEQKLFQLHSRLQLKYGTFQEEYPEQRMAAMFLTGNETVLEIGGNIGRNSLIIASLLTDSRRLVTLESSPQSANKLIENRDNNYLNFYVEKAALSKRKLVQSGWSTKEASPRGDPNWTPVNTITYDELCKKYNLVFDTFILDCEGAFALILKDEPRILDTVNTVMIENDCGKEDYMFIRSKLEEQSFRCVYEKPLIINGQVTSWFPYTYTFFYQVWKR